jgi:hypothetical protein
MATAKGYDYNFYENVFLSQLSKQVSKLAAVAILGANPVGFSALVITYLAGIAMDHLVIPTLKFGRRKGVVHFNRKYGLSLDKKRQEAEDNEDVDGFNSAFDAL